MPQTPGWVTLRESVPDYRDEEDFKYAWQQDATIRNSGLPTVIQCGTLYAKCPNPDCNFASRSTGDARRHCKPFAVEAAKIRRHRVKAELRVEPENAFNL